MAEPTIEKCLELLELNIDGLVIDENILKAAHKKLVRRYHPDNVDSAERSTAKMKEVNRANDILSKELERVGSFKVVAPVQRQSYTPPPPPRPERNMGDMLFYRIHTLKCEKIKHKKKMRNEIRDAIVSAFRLTVANIIRTIVILQADSISPIIGDGFTNFIPSALLVYMCISGFNIVLSIIKAIVFCTAVRGMNAEIRKIVNYLDHEDIESLYDIYMSVKGVVENYDNN